MDDEDRTLEGAKRVDLIKRWLASRDRGWVVVDGMRTELRHRQFEDVKEGHDPKRFDGVPDVLADEVRRIEDSNRRSGI